MDLMRLNVKGEKTMLELVREIEVADLSKLEELMALVFGDGEWRDIQRLGGMTNRSYKITREDGREYLVRIPGDGTEKMLNRQDERKSTELACRLGIDSPLVYFGNDGRKVMEFIRGPQLMSEDVMKERKNLLQAASIFRRLHTCGEDTGVRFEVFEMAELYEGLIRGDGVSLYDDYDEIKQAVMDIKAAADAMGGVVPRVPCHNDSLIGNWVLNEDGRLYLVDWEYSGMNEAMWDLSCLSIEAGYSRQDDDELLEAYYGRHVSGGEKKRFLAAKLYVDYLWTLWGLTRVPFDGDFMQEYANTRYSRLKKNIDVYNKIG